MTELVVRRLLIDLEQPVARHLLGKNGLLTGSFAGWRRYFREDFHPAQDDSTLAARWLADNAHAYTRVGPPEVQGVFC